MRLQPPEPDMLIPPPTLGSDLFALVNDRSTADIGFLLDTGQSAEATSSAEYANVAPPPLQCPPDQSFFRLEPRPAMPRTMSTGTATGVTAHSELDAVDGARVVYAHRALLASRAPYFQHLLCGPFSEASRFSRNNAGARLVRLSGVSRAALLRVMTFLYTGQLAQTEVWHGGATPVQTPHQAAELLVAANQYQLDALLAHTEVLIKDMLTPCNVGSAFHLAEQYNAAQLRRYCLWYGQKHERRLIEVASNCAHPSQELLPNFRESMGGGGGRYATRWVSCSYSSSRGRVILCSC